MTSKLTLYIGAGILVAGIILFLVGLRPPPPRTFHGSVKDLLPKIEDLPGWKVEYLPIAETPEIQAKIIETLNYDDAIFCVFTRGSSRVFVYIAYWMPGRMPYRLISSHTPDVCWTQIGWTIERAEHRYELADERKAAPKCEYRLMRRGEALEYVYFWHYANGDTIAYEAVGLPPWYAAMTDMISRNLDQRPEQFFIRISSNATLDVENARIAQHIFMSLASHGNEK